MRLMLQTLIEKDIRLELRRIDAWVALALFGVLLVVLTSMSLYTDDPSTAAAAPAVIWMSTLFSSTLLIGRTWSHENALSAGDLVWLSPTPRWQIFLSKLLVAFFLSTLVQGLVAACTSVLLRVNPWHWQLWCVLGLGNFGFLSLGTLLGSLSTRVKMGDLALTIALFPLSSPGLLASVVATRELLINHNPVNGWIQVLCAFDLIALCLALYLFESLHQE